MISLHNVDSLAQHLGSNLHSPVLLALVPTIRHVIVALELEVGVVAVLRVCGGDRHDGF